MEDTEKTKEAIQNAKHIPVTTHGEPMSLLIDSLLTKEPEKRPSIDQILKENALLTEEAKVLVNVIEKIRRVNSGQVSSFIVVFVAEKSSVGKSCLLSRIRDGSYS